MASIKISVDAAFAAAGDLLADITWRKQAFGAYDPTAGTQAVVNTDRDMKAIMGEFKKGERESRSLSAKAVKLFVRNADFEAAPAFEPKHEDKLLYAGQTYTVKNAFWEGAPILWEVWADV